MSTQQEILSLRAALRAGGLHAALGFLNARTAFRFTGLYRFDGDILRNVALYDRWSPREARGADAPMAQTFCAIVGQLHGPLEVSDGRNDRRFPWMQANAVVSYCGVPVLDADGKPVGSLCHFDLKPCQAATSELSLMVQAAELFRDAVTGA